MGILKSTTISVTATGADGSAAGNADSDAFVGQIVGIYVNHHTNAPTTSDTTITDKRTGVTIWTLNNSKTDVYKVPEIGAVDNADAALLSATANGVHSRPYHVDQGVNVAIAQGNSITNHTVVTVFYRK